MKQELNVDSELVVGSNGIFTIAVNDSVVVEKTSWSWPSEDQIVDAVAKALGK